MSDRRSSGRRDDRGGGGGGGGDRRRDEDSRGDRHRGNGDSRPRRDEGRQNGMGGGGGGGPRRDGFTGGPFTESELMSDLPKKKFTGRCRLFVGNLPNEVKEQELKDLFSPHGDIAECYLSGKGFAFLRLDTRAHAESAKEAIDGRIIHGRQVRVRFAVHGAALRVKELSPTVSNEMLYHAFSHFGEVERAVHIVDEKGRPTGEGIVEFERKPSANEAIQAIKDRVFLLTASPKPLMVEVLDPRDEDDGLAERMIPRTPQLLKEREMGPRFPAPNSFEFVYGQKWKELYETEKQRRLQLEQELKESRRRLEADMELAYQDYQAQMLREDLQRRQQELERLEAARRERMGGMNRMDNPPPGMGNIFSSPPQESNPFGNPFGGPNQSAQNNGPPPFMSGPPPQQGGYGQAPPQMRSGGGNVIEGVQRLLQIFKTEPPNQQPPMRGGGPPQGMGNFFQQGGPPMGGGGPPFGQPPQFNRGPSDYPPEKRRR